jgi:putative hydrolase
MIYDFHTHSFLSDGELSPVEQVRRALVRGYAALAITDHAGMGNLQATLSTVLAERALLAGLWPIDLLAGVEITHVPPAAIARVAKAARQLGAQVIVVHGETPVEPVEPGTNLAAVLCDEVDILGHPGLITLQEAEKAAERGIFLELTSRRGHSLCNGHVARVAKEVGAKLIVDSDAHSPDDLLTEELVRKVVLGAGLKEEDLEDVLVRHPQELLRRALAREGVQ